MGHLYAGVLSMIAMATVLVRGMLFNAGPEGTLQQAWLAMVAFAMVGFALGSIAETAVVSSVRLKMKEQLAVQPNGGDDI